MKDIQPCLRLDNLVRMFMKHSVSYYAMPYNHKEELKQTENKRSLLLSTSSVQELGSSLNNKQNKTIIRTWQMTQIYKDFETFSQDNDVQDVSSDSKH